MSRHDAVEIRELEMPQFTLSKEVILSDFFEEYMSKFTALKYFLKTPEYGKSRDTTASTRLSWC